MPSVIRRQSTKILTGKIPSDNNCNCRKKIECPLNGNCLTTATIYKETVTTAMGTKIYIGMTERPFKIQFNNHKLSFKHRKHCHDTALSKFIWDLKDSNTYFSTSWPIIRKASPYKGDPSNCNLCLREKLNADESTLLNKRSELIAKCQYKNKWYAVNHKSLSPDRLL